MEITGLDSLRETYHKKLKGSCFIENFMFTHEHIPLTRNRLINSDKIIGQIDKIEPYFIKVLKHQFF